MTVSPSAVVEIGKVIAALKIGERFDWRGARAAFEGQDTKAKIISGLIAVDDVAQIVGLFFPPAAVIANDLKIAIAIEEIAKPLIHWIAKQPAPDRRGKISVWGASLDDPDFKGPNP